MPLSEATGWGDHGSGVEVSGSPSPFLGESLRLRDSESRHSFQPPLLQGAVGRYVNYQARARLMIRTKLLRCVGPTRAKDSRFEVTGAGTVAPEDMRRLGSNTVVPI